MRADARKNYEHVLAAAREVFCERGAEASMRDIARRANVGDATLYRHFPTKEALLEPLLRERFDALTAKASELETSYSTGDALVLWLRETIAFTYSRRGILSSMTMAISEVDSALHASCVTLRASGAHLLERAQAAGAARLDIDGTDLFALIGAIAWLHDQPAHAPHAEHLFEVIASAILVEGAGSSNSTSAARKKCK